MQTRKAFRSQVVYYTRVHAVLAVLHLSKPFNSQAEAFYSPQKRSRLTLLQSNNKCYKNNNNKKTCMALSADQLKQNKMMSYEKKKSGSAYSWVIKTLCRRQWHKPIVLLAAS